MKDILAVGGAVAIVLLTMKLLKNTPTKKRATLYGVTSLAALVAALQTKSPTAGHFAFTLSAASLYGMVEAFNDHKDWQRFLDWTKQDIDYEEPDLAEANQLEPLNR